MSESSRNPRFLIRRCGVAGRARERAFQGIGASAVSLAVFVAFCLLTLAPSAASAAFTREFSRQIAGPFSSPRGVAIDSADKLWVGDLDTRTLDEFESAATGNTPVKLGAPFATGVLPGNLAVERATTGDIYVTDPAGTHPVEVFEPDGEHVETWGSFEEPHVAIDNTPQSEEIADPSACGTGSLSLSECYVYVSFDTGGGHDAIEKFNSKGMPEEFSGVAPYIHKSEITGRPANLGCGESLPSLVEHGGLAVDGQGDIFVTVPSCNRVFEYFPSGEYKQAIELESKEVPRLGSEGIVGEPLGVTVDPVSGHLVVPVQAGRGTGAIFEFSLATGHFISQVGETAQLPLHELGEPAVDSLGDLYVVDQAQQVIDGWGRGAYLPTLTLGATSERTRSTAVLHGSVSPAQEKNPDRTPTLKECYFQYIPETEFAENVAAHGGKESGGFSGAGVQRAECIPSAAEIKTEHEEAHSATAAIGGLKEGVTYRYRLVTVSGGTLGGSEATAALAFTAPAVPRIEATSAANLSSTSADLRAQIDPLGVATSYHIEYDTREYEQGEGAHGVSAPVPDASIGAGGPTGSSSEGVVQHLGSLAPGTTYYYRVVAENAQGRIAGGVCEAKPAPDCVFTTLPAPVPAERGYELVTPANRQGGGDMFAEPEVNNLITNSNVGEPAESGEGFLLETRSSFGEFPFAVGQLYTFTRELARGQWSDTSLASRSLATQRPEGSPLVALDLSLVAFDDGVGSTLDEGGLQVESLLGPPGARSVCEGAVSLRAATGDGCYIDLHKQAPVHNVQEEHEAATLFVGGSRDLSHVVLEGSSPSICHGGEVQHGDVLCEWAGGYEVLEDGEAAVTLKLVNVKPESESEPRFKCGASLGAASQEDSDGTQQGAVSADGSRVFFTAPDPAAENQGTGCWNGEQAEEEEGPKDSPQLYARVDETSTLEVSAPDPRVKEARHAPLLYPAAYMGASEDGSQAFFLTKTWLTENHPEGHDAELYEWEAEGAGGCVQASSTYNPASRGCLTRVSVGESAKEGAGVSFVPAVSADGSTVYFTAFAALTSGSTQYTPVTENENGPVNVYRYDAKSASVSYVARVDSLDTDHQAACANRLGGVLGDAGPCTELNWYATPDGRYLLFDASLPIEGYNAVAGGCGEPVLPGVGGFGDGRCAELYRYDAEAGKNGGQAIVCVSCGSTAADAEGNAEFARSAPEGPALSGVRGMSDNGEYVFFDSRAALVSQATNHTLDTYQWHEDLDAHARTLSLIGSGSDPAPTFFLGYSPSPSAPTQQAREGGSVFIGTHARLVPQDTNSVGIIYDARVCEPESPCIKPPPGETARCEGGSCQIPPAAPADPTATLLPPSASESLPPPPKRETAAETSAKDLSEALKACKKNRAKKRRAACEKQARKRYGSTETQGSKLKTQASKSSGPSRGRRK
jgi:hypothetical protein